MAQDLDKQPGLHRSLSSISSQISRWSASQPTSPVKRNNPKTNKRKKSIEYQDLTRTVEEDQSAQEQWYLKYAPTCVEEVAIHKRKLNDVATKLEDMLQESDPCRILVLTGPSGCSKSTVIEQLSKQLIPRYRSTTMPFTASRSTMVPDVVHFNNNETPNNMQYLQSFEQFLKDSTYRVGNNLSLILVEDLPNVFHLETRLAFRKALLQWLYTTPSISLPPLILCITECELVSQDKKYFDIDSTFNAETILGKEILSHPKLCRINFNPINATLMKKHLKHICTFNELLLKQQKKWYKRDEMIAQIASNTGDIRSGITVLEFWAKSSADTPIFTRRTSVSYFHAISRVIHGSREYEDDNDMVNALNTVTKGLLTDDNFQLGLLENYTTFNKGQFAIKDAEAIVSSLSQSDTMGDLLESIEYSTRQIRQCFNKYPKADGSRNGKVYFPRNSKIRHQQKRFQTEYEDYNNVSFYKYGQPQLFKDVVLDVGFFAPFIRKRRNYNRKAITSHLNNIKFADQRQYDVLLQENKDNLVVDDALDVVERIGGTLSPLSEEEQFVAPTEYVENSNVSLLDKYEKQRDERLRRLLDLNAVSDTLLNDIAGENEVNMLEMDPIEDDEDDIDKSATGVTSFLDEDDSLYDFLSQRTPRQARPTESLSDSDLEGL